MVYKVPGSDILTVIDSIKAYLDENSETFKNK